MINFDSAVRAVQVLAALKRVPGDRSTIQNALRAAGSELTPQRLARSIRDIGIPARTELAEGARLSAESLPVLAFDHQANPLLIVRQAKGEYLVQYAPSMKPVLFSLDRITRLAKGEMIYLGEPKAETDGGPVTAVRWFAAVFARYRGLFREAIIVSLFINILALLSPIIFQVVLDRVFGGGELATLNVLALAMLAVIVFETILTSVRTYLLQHTAARMDIELGSQLFQHLVAMPAAYLAGNAVGKTVARIREVDSVREFVTSSFLALTVDLVFVLLFFAVMFLYSPVLTGLVALSIPLYILISLITTGPLRKALEERFRHGAANQSFLTETLAGASTHKALVTESSLQPRWETQLAALAKSNFESRWYGMLAGDSAQLVSRLVGLGILFFGAQFVIAGALTVGQFIAFNMLAGRVAEPILKLAQTWQDFQSARVGLTRANDLLERPPEWGNRKFASPLPRVAGGIAFNDVTFRYSVNRKPVLDNFSLQIAAGECVAITGPSGTGKTTLAHLLLRFGDPERGAITLDGHDIAQFDPRWLRAQIGFVEQEPTVFSCTVAENIALGLPALAAGKVRLAAQQALAHDFISALEKGYDTELTERGSNLSGGQKQRLALARALIREPKILILDEPTSALDALSRDQIIANLRALSRERTTLIITHDPAVAQACDRVVRLNAL